MTEGLTAGFRGVDGTGSQGVLARRQEDAVRLREQVSAELDQVLGPEHPNTVTARASLARARAPALRPPSPAQLPRIEPTRYGVARMDPITLIVAALAAGAAPARSTR